MQSRESPDSRPWDVGISGEVFQPGLILNTVYHLRIKGVGKGGGGCSTSFFLCKWEGLIR